MSISDGQPVNASASNAAWVSKTANDTKTGTLGLNNAGSGPAVTNTQQDINDLKTDIGTLETTVPAIQSDIADLQSLSGVPDGDTDLGTFTGSVIPDNSDNKEALQALETEVELKIDLSEKSAPNGVATLDGGGKVPVAQLPNSIMEYLGTWAANTNTPTLADGVGDAGDVYIVDVAGSQDLGSGSQTFAVGDWVVYNGTIWQKSSNSNAVASVNGFTGIVNLGLDDLSDVDEAAPANRDVLKYNGSDWVGEQLDSSANDNATGSNVTLSSVTTSVVRLTNASLVSIDMIPAGFSAQKFILENKTTVQITINNETGATAADRILTGTEGPLELGVNSSLQFVYDSSSARWMIVGGTGGGSGSGGINYISNPNAETVITPWVAYQDAAGVSPVDGTGGSPSITLTQDTNSLVVGTTSFLITKGASNEQGEGVSCDFTIDQALANKPLSISNYYTATGNFVWGTINGVTPSDITVYVYDVTNAALITPFPNTLDGSGVFTGSFQATNSLSYRLIYHIGTTNALFWSFYFGEVVVGPLDTPYIEADSNWVDYTASLSASMGAATLNFSRYKKSGTDIEIEFGWTMPASGTTGSPIQIGLPSGLLIATNAAYTNPLHKGIYLRTGPSTPHGGGVLVQSGLSYLTLGDALTWSNQSVTTMTPINGNDLAASATYRAYVKFQVQGWTSGYATPAVSVQNVPVQFSAYKSAGSVTANTTIASWTGVLSQNSMGWNATTGQFTVYSPGVYNIVFNEQTTSADLDWPQIAINGSILSTGTGGGSNNSRKIAYLKKYLNVGDIVTVSHSGNATIATNTTGTILSIEKANDPSAFLTIPKVATIKDVKAANTAGGTFTSGSFVTRTLNTLNDPFGIVSLASNQFTLQPGTYRIRATAPAYRVNNHQAKLRNITASSDTIIGSSQFALQETGIGSAVTESVIADVFSITVATIFEIQHRCGTTQSTNGLGIQCNFGVSEVYTQVEIQKLL